MNVGYRIKERRKALGLSADDIASALNVDRSTIYRYESNDIEKLPTKVLEPLSFILKTTPSYLMGWSDQTSQTEINIQNEIPILQKYNKLNNIGQEKADTYISDLLENPKYVAEAYQGECGYASIAADTGKNGRIPAPDFDTIIQLNKENQ